MKVQFIEITAAKTKQDDAIVFFVGEDKKLSPAAQAINKQAGGVLRPRLPE